MSHEPWLNPAAMASLLQLDPMPMESPAVTPSTVPADAADDDLPPLPLDDVEKGIDTREKSPKSHSRSLSASAMGSIGLHTGHGAVFYLSRIQRYSSYAFTIFTSVHLATTSLIPLACRSVPSSEAYLLLAREIYQTRVSEPLLVAIPVVAHVAAGVGLRLVRRNQNLRRYGGAAPGVFSSRGRAPTWRDRCVNACTALGRRVTSGWPPLSWISVSGYVFAATLAGHVFVNRLLPLAVEGDSSDIGLAYVAHGFARHPVASWTGYVVFLGAASGHVVWGWARWLRVAQRATWSWGLGGGDNGSDGAGNSKAARRRARHTWLLVQGSMLVTFGLWASGSLGVVARGGLTTGWVAKIYDGLYSQIGL